MKERGRYQIQFMKTRSSSGVGQKVDLEFDVDSLRIRDLADDPEYKQFDKQRSTISQNTVEVNSENSIEGWSSFRVARRALINNKESLINNNQEN